MRIALAITAVVIATALAGVAAGRWWAANGVITVSSPTVVGEATGTVDIVNQARTSICLTPSSGGEQLCGDLWRPAERSVPAVGDEVGVWIVRVPTSDGVSVDELILKPAADVGT